MDAARAMINRESTRARVCVCVCPQKGSLPDCGRWGGGAAARAVAADPNVGELLLRHKYSNCTIILLRLSSIHFLRSHLASSLPIMPTRGSTSPGKRAAMALPALAAMASCAAAHGGGTAPAAPACPVGTTQLESFAVNASASSWPWLAW